jgi:hypothetical protein
VLTLQQARRFGRHPSEDQVLGVDDVPLPLHTAGSGNKRTHEDPFDLSNLSPWLQTAPPEPIGAASQPLFQDGKPKGY